jgi:hypothetical protein
MEDIMLDLETLGTGQNSVILQVGLAIFDITTGEVGNTLELNISLQDSLDCGFSIDGRTVAWWMRQADGARQSVLASPSYPVEVALDLISDFVIQIKDPRLWSHATFDAPILNNYYQKMGKRPPYRYRQQMDLRTMGFLCRELDFPLGKSPKIGERHTALADCLRQVKQLSAAYQKIVVARGEE